MKKKSERKGCQSPDTAIEYNAVAVMATEKNLISTLRRRIRISPSRSSVSGSLPVLFFGDALAARLATIGLNPSKFEYLDRYGNVLSGRGQRFATVTSLGAASRDGLSDPQVDKATEAMRSYYDEGRPVYGAYFRHLNNFLRGMGASYGNRTATHLDLVQESTDPVWSQLIDSERSALLERDVPFLLWQLENLPNLKAVVCTCKTVSGQVRSRARVDVKYTGAMKRILWWLGTAHFGQRDLPIGGWNYPLHRPTGLGAAGEIELGRVFAKGLL